MMVTAISTKSVLYGMLASTSLCIGLIGIALPGLPSTEFILLAVWAASKCSPTAHAWLMDRRLIANVVGNYKQGTVPRRAKLAATVTMTLSGLVMINCVNHVPSVVCTLALMIGVLTWLWLRPE